MPTDIAMGSGGRVRTMQACRFHLPGAIFLLALAGSAPAALADVRQDCEKLKGEASLNACSAVIEAGSYGARDLATAYYNRGLEYFDKGYYDQAINDYGAAIRLDARNADVYNNRGNVYQVKRDYDRAISDFDTAVSLNPRHVLAYNNRGIAHAAKGELDLAIRDYDQAVALNPAYAAAYNNRGYAYSRQGDARRAIADYDQAIVISPKDALIYRNRAKAHQALGQYELAIADYRRSLDLRPSERAAAGLKVAEALFAARAKDIEEGPEPTTFRQMPNTDLVGSLIGKVDAASAAQCESACGQDRTCQAYSFNLWNAMCFLKSDATLRFLDPSTVSGLKSEAYPPPISDAMMSMLRFRNKAFPGEPLRASPENRFEDCEASCETSESCVAFSFVKAESMCRIFEQAGGYTSDDGVDSGAKRQVVN